LAEELEVKILLTTSSDRRTEKQVELSEAIPIVCLLVPRVLAVSLAGTLLVMGALFFVVKDMDVDGFRVWLVSWLFQRWLLTKQTK